MAQTPEEIKRIHREAREQARLFERNPRALVDFCHQHGLSNEEIVVKMTQNKSAAMVRAFAEKFAADLGMTPAQFIKIAGPRSVKR